jgi:hypothetical protein
MKTETVLGLVLVFSAFSFAIGAEMRRASEPDCYPTGRFTVYTGGPVLDSETGRLCIPVGGTSGLDGLDVCRVRK